MDQLQEAVRRLKNGEVVGLPTETVYGLAARISDPKAIEKIFAIKERPFFDPLIVHVHSLEQAKTSVGDFGVAATLLAQTFWPGPLTLVLKKKSAISDLITSGLVTVGIRCPNHSMALEVIKKLGEPVAAPSANKFGRTSPTSAEHVRAEFGRDVFVLDGGQCQVGIESTIIKIEEDSDNKVELTILRAGMITSSQIIDCLKSLDMAIDLKMPSHNIEAPGQVEHHYMPSIPLFYVTEGDLHGLPIEETASQLCGRRLGTIKELELSESPELAARQLYGRMRERAESGAEAICFVEKSVHKGELWTGVLDRLYRASTYKSKSVIRKRG